MQEAFDIVVIGGGPGGYIAAIKAAQLGKRVACVELRPYLGGTCLNVGCIPSKALLSSSYKYFEAAKHFGDHGIECNGLSISVDKMMLRKERVITELAKGIEGLFNKNKVVHIRGRASFHTKHEIKIELIGGGEQVISGANVIIATGSVASTLPNIEVDEKQIVTSSGALSLHEVPKRMVVLGGGVIGVEIGSVWSRLGSKVTIIEYLDRVLAGSDKTISHEAQKILTKQGIKFLLSTKALGAAVVGNSVQLDIDSSVGAERLQCDVLLIAIGRKPYCEGLRLERIGITLDSKGHIPVNHNFETAVPNVFAIGDVIRGVMLAHKAEEEGIAVAEIIAGQAGHVNYNTIPNVVYTTPEIASVGKTEEQVKSEGVEYKAVKFPFIANSRARTSSEIEGFVKLITDKKSDTILGAHIIGPHAGELISELCVGMEFKAAAEDIARVSHAHPGYSEAIKEAALAAFASAIHI